MAHILEFMTADKKFSPSEVIQEAITNLISKINQYQLLSTAPDSEKAVTDAWRSDLFMIRNAVAAVLDKEA